MCSGKNLTCSSGTFLTLIYLCKILLSFELCTAPAEINVIIVKKNLSFFL